MPFTKKNELCGEIDQIIEPNLLDDTPQDDVLGYFEFLDPFVESGARVVGWAYAAGQQVECIALLNQESIVRGFAKAGFNRPDVTWVLGISDQRSGWVGYVRVPSGDEKLTAYVLFADSDRWISLRNSHSFDNPGKIDVSIYHYFIDAPW